MDMKDLAWMKKPIETLQHFIEIAASDFRFH
jgi:hypothetical protein